MNEVMLTGRLTKAPELTHIGEKQTANAKFAIAVDRNNKKKLEEAGRQSVDFIPIVVWGAIAESCNKYLDKGSKILVKGELQIRSWDDQEGKKRWTTEVLASKIEFLEFGKKDSSGSHDSDSYGNEFAGFNPMDDDEELPF